jgi:hypothetical protein
MPGENVVISVEVADTAANVPAATFVSVPPEVPAGIPAMYIEVKMAPLKISVDCDVNYTVTAAYAVKGQDGKLVPSELEADAIIIDQATKIGLFKYGANVGITVALAPEPAVALDEFVVKVNGEAVLDKVGNYCMSAVTKDLVVFAGEPPVYTENLLVTLGQDGADVVVVFTALDNMVNKDVNGDPIETTIPNVTVDLKLNYSYINEFGNVTAESYEFSVEYTEKQIEPFEISDKDFVKELGDDYQYAFSITGSYVFGDETIDLFKTAYKPVEPEAEA